MRSDTSFRPGEVLAPLDPAGMPANAGLVFIGRVRTPWTDRATCPKNPMEAGHTPATIEVDPPWRAGLTGLAGVSHVIVLTWMDRARRDLLVQAPRHAALPRGTFALRSPVRPNPIGLVVAAVQAFDAEAGRIVVRGMDCLDGTPLLDIKPYFASIDAKPEATRPGEAA